MLTVNGLVEKRIKPPDLYDPGAKKLTIINIL